VVRAKIDKTRAISDAESYQYEEIPAAKGRAARLKAEAQAYFTEAVQNAKGEAERFLQLLSEYRKNKDQTRYRLYMEAIQEILAGVEKSYILDTAHGRKPATIKLLR